jgi:hypothetical protein
MIHMLVGAADAPPRYQYFTEPPPQLPPEKGLRWLPVEDNAPAPREDEILDGPMLSVEADRVRRVWTVRLKTYAEKLTAVQAARRQAYPAAGDQLDALFKARAGDGAELAAIDAAIQAVKAAHPKPVA